MAEHSDAAEQIDEQTPPEEGTDVDEHDTDADLGKMLKRLHRSGFQAHAH